MLLCLQVAALEGAFGQGAAQVVTSGERLIFGDFMIPSAHPASFV